MHNDLKEIFHGTCECFNKTMATLKRKYHDPIVLRRFFHMLAICQ